MPFTLFCQVLEEALALLAGSAAQDEQSSSSHGSTTLISAKHEMYGEQRSNSVSGEFQTGDECVSTSSIRGIAGGRLLNSKLLPSMERLRHNKQPPRQLSPALDEDTRSGDVMSASDITIGVSDSAEDGSSSSDTTGAPATTSCVMKPRKAQSSHLPFAQAGNSTLRSSQQLLPPLDASPSAVSLSRGTMISGTSTPGRRTGGKISPSKSLPRSGGCTPLRGGMTGGASIRAGGGDGGEKSTPISNFRRNTGSTAELLSRTSEKLHKLGS